MSKFINVARNKNMIACGECNYFEKTKYQQKMERIKTILRKKAKK